MHRVTLCLLLEGSLEGQNGKGWHLYIIRENITFICHTSDMIITINCALPNYDPMSETFILKTRVKKWIEGGDKWGQGFEEGNRVDAKQERGTEKRKPGRPTKAESLGKSRKDSTSSIISLLSKRGRTSDSDSGKEDDSGTTQSVKRVKESPSRLIA
ncbi:hypothetical protein G5I_00254 [Acromyrmex echinatior]|uniref:Uncharacterized protein n=1 Tax=Acromyrmex echinatior TaxID=103372 RepID=F4W4D4_ACREC|nr:hypothetical protein G5I_00254 [Acromyrmex echinatior]